MANAKCGATARLAAAIALYATLAGCAHVRFVAAPSAGALPPPPPQHLPVGIPASGDVLLAGGIGSKFSGLASTEFYQQSTGTFVASGNLPAPLAGVALAALPATPDKLLAAGGAILQSSQANGILTYSGRPLASAAIFSSTTGRFAATGALVMKRAMAAATTLQDGTVLITGGLDPLGRPVSTAEIYNPATGTFTATAAPMHLPRAMHTATLLTSGKVLVYGGMTDKYGTTSQIGELYTPATRRFFKIPTLFPSSLMAHTATLISGCGCKADGQVLLADGATSAVNQGYHFELTLPGAMLYDPATDKAVAEQALDSRAFHTATLLPGGKVMLAGGLVGDIYWTATGIGGYSTNAVNQSVEIFDPRTSLITCVNGNTGFACNPSLAAERGAHVATYVTAGPNAGKVLLAGGFGSGGTPVNSSELFDPVALTSSPGPQLTTPRALAASLPLP